MTRPRITFIVWAGIFATALAAGFYTYTHIYKGFMEKGAVRFDEKTKRVYANILKKGGIDDYAGSLSNLSGLFAASVSVERNEFETFIFNSQYAAQFPATDSFSYIKRITNAEKSAYVNSMRRDATLNKTDHPDFSITPPGMRDEYYVTTYITPHTGNESLLGEDVLMNPAKRNAIETARDTGTFSTTERETRNGKSAFMMVFPIYKNGAAHTTTGERRASIMGVVAVTINLETFIIPAISEIDSAVKKIRLYTYKENTDETTTSQSLIYEYNNREGRQNNLIARSYVFKMGNTNWALGIAESVRDELYPLEIATAFFGGVGIFSILFLMGGTLMRIIAAKNRSVMMAKELAKNLREIEHFLAESSSDINITVDKQYRITAMNDAAIHLLGHSLGDVLGVHIGKTGIIASNSLKTALRTIERALNGEDVRPIELVFIRRMDGLIITEALMAGMSEENETTGVRIILHDITTRKHAENALTRSSAEFILLANNSLDSLLIIKNNSIVFTNTKSAALFKYSGEELLAMKFDTAPIIARESRQTIKTEIQQLQEGGAPHEFECTFFTKDMQRAYAVISMSRVKWNSEDAILLVARDISMRKRLEQRSTMENAIAKTIAESAPEINVVRRLLENIATTFHWQFGGIWMEDQKTNELKLFDCWRQPGYNLDAFEDKSKVLAFKKGVGLPGKVWESGRPRWVSAITQEPTFVRARELEMAALNTAFAFPLIVERTTVGVVEFFTDSKDEKLNKELMNVFVSIGATLGQLLKQRRTNEEIRKRNVDLQKFFLAVEWTQDSVIITDAEGIVQYSNKAAEKMNGYSRNQILGQKAGKLWGNLMPKEYYADMWNTIKTLHRPFTGEIRNRRKSGEEYTAFVNISPVFDEQGVPRFFVATERDITREKEIDRAKTEFVSLASHQLRTPITAINWYAEMLLAGDVGKISKKQRVYLEEIYNGGRRLVMLVNSLLNVSRVELGTFIIQPEMLRPADVCDIALKDIRLLAANKNITINKQIAKDIPEISADAGLLQIIFQNIITNAVEYTKDNGTVTVIMRRQGDDLYFSVADTGVGIPAADQDKIFGKMFRADNARDIKTYGTGLGLYIAKAILTEIKGKIWFDSVENKGTTFYVTLPISGMTPRKGTKMLTVMNDVV